MKANFHTHTFRCRHATGEDREYVEAAISAGLKVLGFSDHIPYWFPDGYYSTHRMRPEETEDYVRSVLDLKKEYEKDIKIHLGFEAEYHERFFDQTLEMLKDYPYEYLILGQHHNNNEMDFPKGISLVGTKQTDPSFLIQNVTETIRALETGKFFYLAHPDLVNFVGDPAIKEREYRRVLEAAKRLSVPVELNLLGIREKRNYPQEFFWKLAGEIGNEVILGCDSHQPHTVGMKSDIEAANAIVARYHLKKIEPMTPFYKNI
ncbi:MAG: histidinol-phosphatase [Clostridia bacterium]|nr:histidinol-phosphatase [Clostridia bacterium]